MRHGGKKDQKGCVRHQVTAAGQQELGLSGRADSIEGGEAQGRLRCMQLGEADLPRGGRARGGKEGLGLCGGCF